VKDPGYEVAMRFVYLDSLDRPHSCGGVQVFHGVVHEGALLPTLLCSLQRYYPNITII
jgi:hypothetical protein